MKISNLIIALSILFGCATNEQNQQEVVEKEIVDNTPFFDKDFTIYSSQNKSKTGTHSLDTRLIFSGDSLEHQSYDSKLESFSYYKIDSTDYDSDGHKIFWVGSKFSRRDINYKDNFGKRTLTEDIIKNIDVSKSFLISFTVFNDLSGYTKSLWDSRTTMISEKGDLYNLTIYYSDSIK